MSKQIVQNFPDAVLPDYEKDCLVAIPNYIKSLHRLSKPSTTLGGKTVDTIQKTALFVIDGFGHKQWQEHQAASTVLTKFMDTDSMKPLTAMYPSSTAISLSGLSTGLTTQQHGLLEWWLYLDEIDSIIITLPFMHLRDSKPDQLLEEGVDPRILLNARTIFEDLNEAGVTSYTLIHNNYATSAYSNLAYAGSKVIPHTNVRELFQNFNKLLQIDEQAHINIYWSEIDAVGHAHGSDSEAYSNEVKKFFDEFELFLAAVPHKNAEKTQVMITADHGQVVINPEETIWLDELSELNNSFAVSKNGIKILPWGSPRALFMRIQPDMLDKTQKLLEKELIGKAVVVRSAEALTEGLFGSGALHPNFKDRIGNLMVLPTGNTTIWYKHYPGEIFNLRGMHGGLTADEMYVPFASQSLDNLL